MTDIKIDENFYVLLDETNDLATVEGYEEFEQEMAHLITDYFFENIGDRNNATVVRKLRLKAKRVAEQSDYVESVDEIDVEYQEGDTLHLYIAYNAGEEFEFEVI